MSRIDREKGGRRKKKGLESLFTIETVVSGEALVQKASKVRRGAHSVKDLKPFLPRRASSNWECESRMGFTSRIIASVLYLISRDSAEDPERHTTNAPEGTKPSSRPSDRAMACSDRALIGPTGRWYGVMHGDSWVSI